MRRLITSVVILSIFLFLWSEYLDDRSKKFMTFYQDFLEIFHDEFLVEQVFITGNTKVSRDQILEIVNNIEGKFIFDIEISELHSRVSSVPWVKNVHVRRSLPNSLHIEIEEQTPLALWQRNGRLILISQDGSEIINVNVPPSYLPFVTGDKAPEQANILFDILASKPGLLRRVKGARNFSGRRWDVILDSLEDGIIVKLPDKDVQMAWNFLYQLDKKEKILSRALSIIDLRVSGRLLVTPKQSYIDSINNQGKEKEKQNIEINNQNINYREM